MHSCKKTVQLATNTSFNIAAVDKGTPDWPPDVIGHWCDLHVRLHPVFLS